MNLHKEIYPANGEPPASGGLTSELYFACQRSAPGASHSLPWRDNAFMGHIVHGSASSTD